MRAAIALGSNLGDRFANLQNARDRIRALDGAMGLIVQSAIYETSPVDCEPGAQNFYNAVIEVGFEKSADALLEALQEIERALGRERTTPAPQSSPPGRGGREAPDEGRTKIDIVGPVCESGDFFAQDREMPELCAGDLLAVMSAGAYGFVMASNYNSRPLPAEALVRGDEVALIRKRQTIEDLVRGEIDP